LFGNDEFGFVRHERFAETEHYGRGDGSDTNVDSLSIWDHRPTACLSPFQKDKTLKPIFQAGMLWSEFESWYKDPAFWTLRSCIVAEDPNFSAACPLNKTANTLVQEKNTAFAPPQFLNHNVKARSLPIKGDAYLTAWVVHECGAYVPIDPNESEDIFQPFNQNSGNKRDKAYKFRTDLPLRQFMLCA
jgi:hypothetical protein